MDQTLRDLIGEAVDFIRQNEPPVGYFLGFSGGKDSIVLLQLARLSGVQFVPVYNFTSIDPPELVRFIKTYYPEVVINKPKRSFFQELRRRRGFVPNAWRRWCCRSLKENEGKYKTGHTLLGVRREESARRSKYERIMQRNQLRKINYYPILHWTEVDIWEAIDYFGLPYPDLYEHFDRLGCVICPFLSVDRRLVGMQRWPKIWHAYYLALRRSLPEHIDLRDHWLRKVIIGMKRINNVFARRYDEVARQYGWPQFGDEWEKYNESRSVSGHSDRGRGVGDLSLGLADRSGQ